MAKIIKKSQIPRLLNFLGRKYQIWAPVKKGKDFIFDLINPYGITDKLNQVVLDYPTTILPPTKILLPPQEALYYTKKTDFVEPLKPNPTIIFGVHSYDIVAIEFLTKIMSKPQPDFNFLERRKNIIIIGVGHKIQPFHFHNLFGLKLKSGYDLFFNQIKNQYLVSTSSEAGKKIAQLAFFEDSDWKIKPKEEEKDPLFSPKLAKILAKEKDHPIWDKLAEICFGCGICSYVCPLCYCFENFNATNFDCTATCKLRRRDACFLPQFFASASLNLKEKLSDRSYFWYHHKFARMFKEYGFPGCVGCGRCILQCPAKINFKRTLEKIAKRK